MARSRMGIRRSFLRAVALLPVLLALGLPGSLSAQAGGGEDSFASDLQEARRLVFRGRLARASMLLKDILASGGPEEPPEERPSPDVSARAAALMARVRLMRGQVAQGLSLVEEFLKKGHPRVDLLLVKGDLLAQVGRYRDAAAAYASASDLDPLNTESRFKRGLMSWTVGARKEARARWKEAVRLGEERKLTRGRDLLFLGKSLERLGRHEEASDLYLEADKLSPLDHDPAVALGNLYFLVYGEVAGYPSGAKEFRRVLRPDKGDPGYVPALLGLFKIYRFNLFRDPSKTESFLDRALARDPGRPETLSLLAGWRIEDRRYAEARTALEKALKRNPNHVPSLSQLYALEWLTRGAKAAAPLRERALSIQPGSPLPDTVLGRHLIHHYRFPEAEPILRRALSLDPEYVPALDALGKVLIYTGRGKEGRKCLEKADSLQEGFVNAPRHNAIEVEKKIEEEYRSWKVGDFVFWMHPSEAPVLLHFLPALYERARASFRARYGYAPKGPIRVEVFHSFGDFSVRTVNFRGFGALGACFGGLITSVSPSAPELRDKFSWAATAWHEFAHTVTLGLSRHRIPRWFTEGISVYEETVCNPADARHMERDLVDALYNGDLPRVDRFNTWFRGRRVLFAYYLAGLSVKMLVQGKGIPTIVRMCRLYGQGLTTRGVLKEGLGWTPSQFDRRFRAWLARRVKNLKIRPRPGPDLLTRLQAQVVARPKDFQVHLDLGWGAYFQGRTVDAGVELAKCLALSPGDGRAKLLEGRLAFAMGNLPKAKASLEEAFQKGADDFFARLELAKIYLSKGRTADGLAQLEAAHQCWPTCTNPRLSPLLQRARLYKEMGQEKRAVAELERFTAIAGDVRPPRLELAAYYKKEGDREKEASYLREALDIDPFDRKVLEEYAQALQVLGEKEKALEMLEAALEVPPELDHAPPQGRKKPTPREEARFQARIRAARAALLMDLGRKEEAREEALRAWKAAPDSPGGKRAKGILEALKEKGLRAPGAKKGKGK